MRPGRTRGIARGSSGGVGGLAVSSSSERNYWFFLLPGDQRARRAPGTLPAAAAALPAVSRGHRGLAGSGRDGSGLRHAGCSGKQLSRFQMSVKVMPPPAQISFHLAFSCPFLSFYSPTRFRSFSQCLLTIPLLSVIPARGKKRGVLRNTDLFPMLSSMLFTPSSPHRMLAHRMLASNRMRWTSLFHTIPSNTLQALPLPERVKMVKLLEER